MADVTDIVQGTTIGLSRAITDDATVGFETYQCPTVQGYIQIDNAGDFDLLLVAGNFTHTIIHPGDTFRGRTKFKTFDIRIYDDLDPLDGDKCEFTATVTEDDELLVNERHYWELAKMIDDIDGDMKLVSANKTTSKATINAQTIGEGGAGYYDVTYTVDLKDTQNTKHTWFDGNFAVEISTDSKDGKVAIKNGINFVTLEEGTGTIVLRYTGEFKQGDKIELTIIGGEKYGYAITDKVVTDTLAA